MQDDYKIPIHTVSEKKPLIIQSVKVLRGANYYSAGEVIVLRLNLGAYDERFTNTIDGFYDALQKTLPSLYEHHCSEDKPGGFFKRVQDGTLLGHVVEHIAIELQTLAGMDVRFGKTRATPEQGVYNVVFRFFDEKAGRYAGESAVSLINSMLLQKQTYVAETVDTLLAIRELHMPGPGTRAILSQAGKRGIPILRADPYNLIQLGTGKYQKRIRGTLGPETSFLAVENVRNSYLSTLMLRDSGIPVPVTLKTTKSEQAVDFQRYLRKPVVVKLPMNSKYRNVFPGLNDIESIKRAFDVCRKHEENVLIQEQIPGETFRLLIINHRFVAATRLNSPEVIGNGQDSIAILIDKLNEKQQRKPGSKASLTYIEQDKHLIETLSFYGYQLQTIPDDGVRIVLNPHTSPALGATTTDVTGVVHPINRFMAERAARIAGLDVAGVNIVCPDISKPITTGQGAIINMLEAPDFGMHLNPWQGKSRNVAQAFTEMIFPAGTRFRIPVFSVTGSAGKSVCALLLNHVLEKEGYQTGLSMTDGIFSQGRKIARGDMTGFHAARLILKDPGIDCAILETSVESILQDGLGYEYADFGLVLNVQQDAIPGSDMRNKEDIAYAKSVVAEEVYPDGFSILNANDPMVMKMRKRIDNTVVLFAKNPPSEHFIKHVSGGGMGVGIEDKTICLWNKKEKVCIASLASLPLLSGEAFSIFTDSLLAAIAALASFGIDAEKTAKHLKVFKPVSHTMHGRLTKARLNTNQILIDKPSGSAALINIREILEANKVQPVFYIDNSGNIPGGFYQQFLSVFGHLSCDTFIFNSSLHSLKGKENSDRNQFDSMIVSLKEYYLQETAPENSKNRISHENTDLSKLNTGNQHIAELDDVAAFLQTIQNQNPENLHIIFSWNYPGLQALLNPLLDLE